MNDPNVVNDGAAHIPVSLVDAIGRLTVSLHFAVARADTLASQVSDMKLELSELREQIARDHQPEGVTVNGAT